MLGSSSALPTSKRFPTAHLLQVDERFFLIDCGEGAQIQMRRFGISASRIHHIFISHLHGDHVFGLFGLMSTLGMLGRKVPLHIYGPKRLKEMIRDHLKLFGPLPYEVEVHPLPSRDTPYIYEDDKIRVRAVPLKHRTMTFGYLFREKERPLNIRKESIREFGLGIEEIARAKRGEDLNREDGTMIPNEQLTLPPYHPRSYAYISDTLFDPGLVEVIRGADLLFHEATFSEKDEKLAAETFHSTAPQAATIARDAGVGKLLIGHFSSRYRDLSVLVEEAREIFGQTYGVDDGEVYSVPLKRESS
ncbi:MAG: ribonuclease Z [Bacteroidales bacterium]